MAEFMHRAGAAATGVIRRAIPVVVAVAAGGAVVMTGAAGANAAVSPHHAGLARDQAASSAGPYYIKNNAHGLCLDAVASGDGSDGDKVQLWKCNGGLNQEWHGVTGTYEITNGAAGLYLDAVRSGDGSNGDQVQLWGSTGQANQEWVLFTVN